MLRPLKNVIPLSRYPVIPFKNKSFFLCILSGILLILSFPNFNLWLFAWFGFVPLFFAIENKSKVKAFLLFYLAGLIFWCGTIYWLIHVTLPGTILLILYLALYFGCFGLFLSTYRLSPITYHLLFIPSFWVLLEYIRSCLFTGFPWALLGYSQYLNLPVIQIADITGAWGVSFAVMMGNVFIYQIIGHRSGSIEKNRGKIIILPVLLLLLSLGYGYYSLRLSPIAYRLLPIKISVIQGNIPQELKWNPDSSDYIIAKYLNISRQASLDRPGLIIWPEAALPVVLEEEPAYFEKVKNLAREIKTPLLIGAVTQRNGLYYNSALLVSGQGEVLNRYDKLHLVPFGEYTPLKRIFGFLQTVVPIGDIERGKVYTVFTQNAIRFSVLICFEDLFPELSREFARKGADFLVNITNDAWYKDTSAPFQHLQASVFRAVENRLNVVRAANTGVSGFIAPSGKIISLVEDSSGRNIFIDGYLTQEIALPKRPLSLYTRYGDIFIAACFLFGLYGIIAPFRKSKA